MMPLAPAGPDTTVRRDVPAAAAAPPSTRVVSIDVLRGLVMFLMLAEAMRLWTLHDAFPASRFWAIVAYNTTHVPWQGCSVHDLIQPAFSLLVGAAMPFSLARRRGAGQSFGRLLTHAVWRSAVLIFLGIFLRSLDRPRTYWTFEDTLTQIGLGYTPLFLLAWTGLRAQAIAFVAILAGFWTAFVLYPLPGPGFDYTQVGVPADWPHLYTGFLAHFNKNSNLSWAFDTWFLNLFPREAPFRFNSGGWSTLSFIPTLATMLLGLWAGRWLQERRPAPRTLRGLLLGGAGLVAAGLLLQALHICPIVKRIWTPAYTLYSGGLVILMLAGIYALTDLKGWRRWAFPLIVIGANSIAVYVMSWTLEHFVSDALVRHLGRAPFQVFGAPFEPVLRGAAVLAVFWSILYWMYRRQIFIRI
jgi:predicted acyltransferase